MNFKHRFIDQPKIVFFFSTLIANMFAFFSFVYQLISEKQT